MATRYRSRAATFAYLRPALAVTVLALFAGGARAAGTYAIAASATILSKNNCTFSTTSGTLAFGNVDPSAGANATATPLILTFRCVGSGNPASYSITSNDGLHATGPAQPRMADAGGTNFLAYTLNTPINGTTPKNTATNVSIQGTITPAQFQNAIAATFTDTVVLTVSP